MLSAIQANYAWKVLTPLRMYLARFPPFICRRVFIDQLTLLVQMYRARNLLLHSTCFITENGRYVSVHFSSRSLLGFIAAWAKMRYPCHFKSWYPQLNGTSRFDY